MDAWFFGSQACYDPAHQDYLVVGGQGPIYGVFTNTAGTPIGLKFQIGSSNDSKPFGVFPRCAFSADVNGGQGGFLVSWHQDDSVNFVHTALVAYPGGVIPNSERVVSDGSGGGSNFRFGVPISYSPTSKRFLIAFGTLAWNLQGRFIGVDGAPVSEIFALANAPSGGGVQEPALTWNSAANEFGLSYSGFDNSGGFVGFKRVSAVDGAQAATPRFGAAIGTFGTGVGYNPANGHYVMGWAVAPGALGAEIDSQGNVLRTGLLSGRLGTPTSFDLAFNPVSGTFLAVSEDSQSSDVVGLQLNNSGTPNTVASTLTNGCANGSFFPRVGARTDAREWNITFARCFTSVADQIVSTTSSEAGPVSDVRLTIDSPVSGAILGPNDTLTVTGWAADRAATSGSGVDAVDVWAFPTNGAAAIFVGGTRSFSTRVDLANVLGAQFVNSGFSVSRSGLPDGTYTITAYPHSTVLGAFDFAHARSVTITKGSSLPLMSIDSPANGAKVGGAITVSGWALDRFSTSGSGIDAVHVWAYPAGGGAARFFGAATLDLSRPDLVPYFGSQFSRAGFSATGLLPNGTYELVAFARDAATQNFSVWQSRTVNVQSQFVVIDSPTGGNVSSGSTISGWAADVATSNGSGIDRVDIWAHDVTFGTDTFVGTANATSRPDVAGLLGGQFAGSGYSATLQNLTPGHTYDLYVFAHSTLVDAWTNARVRINVVN
jgi:hypothetical protein